MDRGRLVSGTDVGIQAIFNVGKNMELMNLRRQIDHDSQEYS
jgi:hypothetical protein